jgi:hypothetical protein
MKLGPFGILNAVKWPKATETGEVPGLRGVPIARLENGLAAIEKIPHELVERRNDFISVRDLQRTTGTKIVLHINYNQSFLLLVGHKSPLKLFRNRTCPVGDHRRPSRLLTSRLPSPLEYRSAQFAAKASRIFIDFDTESR